MKHRTGYLHKRGDNFYVSWRVNGKLFTKALRDDNGQAITTRRAAEDARDKFMAPLAVANETEVLRDITHRLEGKKAELVKWDEEKNPPLPIAQAWSEFLASPGRPDSGSETLYQYECQWQAFVDWMQEKHPEILTVREVTVEIAEEYASHLNHGRLSASTFNKHVNLLMLVFRVVQKKARLTENPWNHPKKGGTIARKKGVTQSRRELTIDELRSVCQLAEGEMRVLLALGVYCGMRLGDCTTLRWGETDLTRGIITRVPNKTARKPGPDGQPKKVIVPIHQTLRAILGEIPVESRGEYVLPGMAELYNKRIDAVTDLVQAHFKKCGVSVWKPGTGPDSKDGKRAVIEVGFHSLRHSFVSLCRASNVPLAVVEELVGHSNPAMTRHYSHTGELAASQAVAALPAVIGDAKPEEPKRDAGAILREIGAIAKSITAKNWKAQKAALLALLPTEC